MEIERRGTATEFSYLAVGEVFEYDMELHLKIADECANSFNLNNDEMVAVPEDAEVKIVNVKIVEG